MNSGLKFYNGLIVFAAVILCMLFIAMPAQIFLGIYGLAITELMLIFIALISAKILKTDFRAVFPLRLPPVRSFFGALFLYAGMYIVIMLVLITTEFLFPSMNEVSKSIVSVGSSAPPAVSIFIMAVMPAVCEETLHRGLILSSFRHIKNTAVIIICAGVIFGLFHLDPYRFLSTALLGGAFAYMTLKSDSMVLPMLFHFITNIVSVYSIYLVGNTVSSTPEAVITYTGVTLCGLWLIFCGIALPAIYTGCRLLDSKTGNSKKMTAIFVISFVFFIAGMVIYGSFSAR